MGQNQKRNKCNSRKNNMKRRKTTKNSWFGEERPKILKDKINVCNKTINRNTRQSEQGYKEKIKETHKIFRQKESTF